MFFVGIASCRDELYVMLLWLRQEYRSLLRLALPVFVVCSVVGVGMTGMPYLPNLCASVPICGRHISARRFCVFRVFCGNTLSACSVGAAETAAPPASSSHGTHSCLGCGPTEFTDLHRMLECVSPRIQNSQKLCVRLVSSGGLRPPPQQEWVL